MSIRSIVVAFAFAGLLLGAFPRGEAPVQAQNAPAASSVTFSETIAPIVYDNCVSCHRPGEAAPFSLISYDDVRNRGKLIAAVTASRYMPPWQATHGFGDFQDERRLTDAQITAIGTWVKDGMPQGDPSKMPALPKFTTGWRLGTPDLVLEMPQEFEVPASGPDIFRNFVIPSKLLEDKWVRAVEFRPRARTVVHHALFAYVRSGAYASIDGADGKPGFRGLAPIGANPNIAPAGPLGGWAVGASPRFLPEGLALPMARNSDFVIQMHFHPSGKVEREKSTVGIYFAEKAPERTLRNLQVPGLFGIGSLAEIPAGERNHVIERSVTLPVDVRVYFANPHAHYLAKEFKATATLPDGTTKPLLWIQDWDFNWQDGYNYKQPVILPKDTRIDVRITYDNSASNPRNPSNPPQRVWWGEQSTDEMGTIGFGLIPVRREDEAAWNAFALQQRNGTLIAAAANGTLQRVAESQGIDLGRAGRGLGQLLGRGRGRGAAPSPAPAGSGADKKSVAVRIFLALVLSAVSLTSAHAQAADEALTAGFAALQKNDADRAASAFRRALAAEPDNPVALYGAGAAAAVLGRHTDAIAFLKRSLQIEPRLVQTSMLLGDVAYHQGDLSFAIKTYENALALAPGNVELREKLAAWRSEATVHDTLRAFKDDRFTILFDGPANRALAERATTVLRDAFWRIGQTLGSYPSNPINVVLYTDTQFHDITGAPEWAGGGFDGQIRMPVGGAAQNLREFDRVLTHELTHAMLYSIAARNVPAWLHEGLAMYFEGNDPAQSEKRLAAARAFVPLANLQHGFSGLTSKQADLAYEMSAFAASALLSRLGPGNLRFVLQDLDRGIELDAAVRRFGLTMADFETQLAKRVSGSRR